MLLSFKHKLIYVKGRKVASTSIEIALAPFFGPSDIVTPITPADEFERLLLGGKCQNYCSDAQLNARYLSLVRSRKFKEALKTGVLSPMVSPFYNHMPLLDIENRLEVPFNQYSLVISERSPYAKIISLANMRLSFDDYRGNAMENSVDDIRRSVGNLLHTGEFRQVHNIGLYRGRKRYKELIVLRQERLKSDLEQLFGRFRLGDGLERLPHAKKGPASMHLVPETVFTREQLDLVNEEFADEFRVFNHEKV